MAEDRHRRDYPSPNLQQPAASSYPYRSPAEHPRHGASTPGSMNSSVTLPSIHDARPGPYSSAPPPHPSQSRAYPDHRYEHSRDPANGYPPPGHQQPPPAGHPPTPGSHLPPPPQYAQPDPRSPAYPPPHDQRGYYGEQRPPPQYAHEPYRQEVYYYPGPPPPAGYAPYGQHAQMQYGPPGHQQHQAAPRQRTSIACKYCRKRKIRCSGYSTAPGGKCQNCARMNQECVFQPVSSSTGAAFIPVSAVPGGVPPGTPLYGAYGQPLAPAHYASGPPGHPGHPPPGGQPPPPHAGPPGSGPPHASQHPHHAPAYYQHAAHSPTGSYSSYGDVKHDDGSVTGRRRRRTSEEHDEGYRLPPPRVSGEDDPRRRSPAEFSNHSSPSAFGHSQAKQEPRPSGGTQPSNSFTTPSNPSAPGGRSPGFATGSSGTSTPATAVPSGPPPSQPGTSSIMSLSNLVDKNDIDSGMLSRLNRTKSTGSSHTNSQNGSR